MVRVVAMTTRTQLHADETFSVMLSQCNPAYYTPLPDSTELTGAQIKGMLVVNHPLSADLNTLYHNNGDSPHASLYYMALRVALSGLTHFDATDIALRGGLLNLLFFVIAFVALWQTGRIVFCGLRGSKLVTTAVLATAFGTNAAIECSLLVREYQMAEMFICLTVWASATICYSINRHRSVSARTWAAYTFAIAGTASTGYLNAFFVALLSVPMVCMAIAHKNTRAAIAVVVAPLAAVAIAYVAYLGYFNFILYPSVHTNRAFEGFATVPTVIFAETLFTNGLMLPGLILTAALLLLALLSRERATMVQTGRQWWIPLCAIAAMVLVEYTSLLREARYIFPLLAPASLLIGLFISGIDQQLCKVAAVTTALYMTAMCPFSTPKMDFGWTAMHDKLKGGAVLYRLNSNELPQIAPALNDTVSYRLISSPELLSPTEPLPVISRIKPPLKDIASSNKITGPLKCSYSAKQ